MLKKFTALSAILVMALLLADHAFTSSGGPPAGHTGAPGESTCLSCHGGSTLNPGNAIRTLVFNGSAAVTSYVPGQTYTAVFTVVNPATTVFGFQMIAKNSTGTNVGTFIATNAAQAQLSGGYMEQTFAGRLATTPGTKSWSFSWTAPAAGTGNVTFYTATNVANADGSTGGDQIYTNAFVLTEAVSAPSIAAATLSAPAVCRGGSVTVNFTTTGSFSAGNVFTAELSDANGSFANPTSLGSITATTAGPITGLTPAGAAAGNNYRVRVVASAPATTGLESNAFTIAVPAANPTISYDGRTLTATGTGPYVWLRNGNPIAGATTATYVPTQIGTYIVGIENVACSPSLSNGLQVLAGFTSVQSLQVTEVCEGSSLLLNYSIFGNFNTSNVFTAELISATGAVTSLNTLPGIGNQVVAILPAGLVGADFSYRITASDPVAVTPASLPFDLVSAPVAPVITANGFELSSNITTNVQWFKDQQPIPNATNPTYTVTENGSYDAQVADSNCTSPFSNAIVFSNVSVAEQAALRFRMYPNPAQDVLNLVTEQPGTLIIRDLRGSELQRMSLEAGQQQLSIAALSAGVYLLQWQDATGNQLRRLVKQ